LPFLPPWQIPSVLKSCTCIVTLENSNSPVLNYHIPAVPAEAIATGRCTLLSQEVHKKAPYAEFESGKEVLVVDSKDSIAMKESLESIIENHVVANDIGATAYLAFIKNQHEQRYLSDIVQIYKSLFK